MRDVVLFSVLGLASGSVYGLAGMGLVLTYKTSGIFNFAHGVVAAAMAYAFYDLRELHGLPWPVALLICAFVLAPIGSWLLERMGRRLATAPVVMKVVATVGLLVGVQQAFLLHYGKTTIQPKSFLPQETFDLLGVKIGYDQLITVVITLVAAAALTWFFRFSVLGRAMRAVVDNADLLSLTGVSPTTVRRWAWYIGTAFAGLSGILIAPTIGLDAGVLTLLVVASFGAAAFGLFTSIPLTCVGGLVIGLAASLGTKYLHSFSSLNGIPASLPFLVLFGVLVGVPRRWLADFTIEHKLPAVERRELPRGVVAVLAVVGAIVVLRLPDLVGAHLISYTSGLVYVILFLSVSLMIRTSGQISLAQLSFAAVGAVTSSRLVVDVHVPWLFAVMAGALAAVPVGAVLAIPAIRRSGLYLALATFGFAVLLEQLVFPMSFMFGKATSALPAPRPTFADGDRAYFYVVLAFVIAAALLVVAIHRSRLGRLLRAMSDSPVALNTFGTNVMTVKVVVFCISAFLAGLAGALLGPVTRAASPQTFGSFLSLQLVAVIALVPAGASAGAVAGATGLAVIPSYITSADLRDWVPLLFGVGAVVVAMFGGTPRVPARLARLATRVRPRPERSPAKARVARAAELGAAS